MSRLSLVEKLNLTEIATPTVRTSTPNAYLTLSSFRSDKAVFYSFFKTLVDQEVTVELKNDLSIKGILKSVDQFLNIKLDDITVLEENKYPHLVSSSIPTTLTRQVAVKNVFIRGSVVRYVHLPASAVDTALLEDATRRGQPHVETFADNVEAAATRAKAATVA